MNAVTRSLLIALAASPVLVSLALAADEFRQDDAGAVQRAADHPTGRK